VAWLLLAAGLLTHDAGDAAFTTSGSGGAVRNKAGVLGAWVADGLFFLLGFSAWWLLPVALRAWLAALARNLRGGVPAAAGAPLPRLAFWAGLALLLAASCALEWTRLYRWEGQLPGHGAWRKERQKPLFAEMPDRCSSSWPSCRRWTCSTRASKLPAGRWRPRRWR
jgi:DNA segregation ATPase FtsK/SpoIIIE, S-DNA-T family